MRLLLELLLAAALVATAWEKPYHEWLGDAVPMLAPPSEPAPPSIAHPAIPVKGQPAAAASPSGAWMWDKNRKSTLDQPAYNKDRPFNGHISFQDESGRHYWIDGEGKRHYE